jgi:hypothetical protein
LFAVPGIATNETAVGEKVRTVPAAVVEKPLLAMVIVQFPLAPANTRPASAPKLHVARLLEE